MTIAKPNERRAGPGPLVPHPEDAGVLAATRRWVERAVIGLNLCPFAKGVYMKEQVCYAVSGATDLPSVLADLEAELLALADADPARIDQTLLILPQALENFADFNDCLYFADNLLKVLRLAGTLQIASFHPRYQFDGTQPDDIENYTNRAPYPTLHLLREASIERAVDAFPDAADIYERNQRVLRELGHDGWRARMGPASGGKD